MSLCWGQQGPNQSSRGAGREVQSQAPSLAHPKLGDPSPALFAGTGSDFPQEQDPSRITGKGLLLEGLLPPLTVAVPLQDRCLRRRPGRTGRAAARGCPRPCA